MFKFESIEFTTQSIMNKEKKRLVEELCEFLGVERNNFRLQQGCITLYGLNEASVWIPLTSHISDFAERLKHKGYLSYKLKTQLQVNSKKK